MKLTVAIVLVVASIVSAEPPRFQGVRQQRQFQRQEEAPYAPSGFRPQGEQFNLPERQQVQPNQPPSVNYGTPLNPTYGPPQTTTEKNEETTENYTETPTTESQSENIEIKSAEDKEETQGKNGPYYVVLPQIQKQNLLVSVPTVATKQNLVYAAPIQKSQLLQFSPYQQLDKDNLGLLYPVQKSANLELAQVAVPYTDAFSSAVTSSFYTSYPQQYYTLL